MINFFIHPDQRSVSHKDYKKTRIYTWAMLVIGVFLIPYCIYFFINYPNDTIKNLTNFVFGGLFLVGILISRLTNKFIYSAIFITAISYPPVMISVYNTGGIYSVDIVWFFVCLFTQCVFLDYRLGITAAIVVMFYYTYLYIAEQSVTVSNNIFKNYIIGHNSTHNFFTLIFVTALIIALLSTFSKTLKVTNKKLEALSKGRIDELENRLLEKTKELSQIRQTLAKDFHDEMGNKLASISLLSQSVGLKINEKNSPEEISNLLSTIEKRSKELYEGTKDFIWSIDFKSDYTDELFVYIRDFGEIFFEPFEISFYSDYKVDSNTPKRLTAITGRQMVYVCKEIMTNSAKHANCTEVSFSMECEGNELIILLNDNGGGFVKETVTKRGLRNIEQRVKDVNGNIEIVSSSKGTYYKIVIPLDSETLSVSDSTIKSMIS